MPQIFTPLSHGGQKSIKTPEIPMKPLEEASRKINEFPSKYRNFSSLTTKRPMCGKYKQWNGQMVLP